MEKTTKTCTKCKIEKEFYLFIQDKTKKDGCRNVCKECNREYILKSHDRLIEYNKVHRIKNKEKIKISQKKYYDHNKDKKWEYEKKRREHEDVKIKIKENSKKFYNTEQAKQKRKEYYELNREKILERQKEHRLNNSDDFKSIQRKYRQSVKGIIAEKNKYHNRRTNYVNGDVTNLQLKNLYENTKNCYWCGKKLVHNNIHLDHYIPISKGGIHTISNLVLACSSCNLSKSDKDPVQFANSIGKLL